MFNKMIVPTGNGGGINPIDASNPDILDHRSLTSGTYTLAVTKKPRLIVISEAHASVGWNVVTIWSEDTVFAYVQESTSVWTASDTYNQIVSVTDTQIQYKHISANASYITVTAWY